jgi:Ca2+-binding RTX toxin-like protein
MRRKSFKSLRKFERLENRWMMAADIDLDGDELIVEGTNNDDHITIEPTTIVDNGDSEDGVLVTIRAGYNGPVLLQESFELDRIDELVVSALDGNDYVVNSTNIPGTFYGGDDNDTLKGGLADDEIYGQAGDDRIVGNQGNDDLAGGVGNDKYSFQLYSTLESDVVYEDASLDTDLLDFFAFDGPVNLDLASTAEQIVNPGHLTLRLSSATGIEDVWGTEFGDTIRGNSRDNWLAGGEGGDDLYGRGGADRMEGNLGDDDLFGEEGNDTYVFLGYSLGTD